MYDIIKSKRMMKTNKKDMIEVGEYEKTKNDKTKIKCKDKHK